MELKKLIKNTVAELDSIAKDDIEFQQHLDSNSEKEFLELIKSKTEVLFLGLKTKEIVNIEDKLEITLKYLELLLTKIDERLNEIG